MRRRPGIGALGLFVVVAASVVACRRSTPERPAPVEQDDPTPSTPPCEASLCGPSCVDLQSDPAHCGTCELACPEGQGCAAGLCASTIRWTATAFTAIGYRCAAGKRFAYVCPADGDAFDVWGTGLYTDDSSICTAAVHAGRVDRFVGGAVAIEVRETTAPYVGSSRFGVRSRDAQGTCGFVFVGTECAPVTTRCTGACVDPQSDHDHCGACDHTCAADESCRKGACTKGITIDWDAKPKGVACPVAGAASGATATLYCPPGTERFSVWGSDVYTNDSSVCTAAVHAGKIGAGGGTVTIETRPGLGRYRGTTRNGVTTTSYGPWTCSFVFK